MFDKKIDISQVYGAKRFEKKIDRGLTNALYRPKPKWLRDKLKREALALSKKARRRKK